MLIHNETIDSIINENSQVQKFTFFPSKFTAFHEKNFIRMS